MRPRTAALIALIAYGFALFYRLGIFVFQAVCVNAYSAFTGTHFYELFWRANWLLEILFLYLPPILFFWVFWRKGGGDAE